MLDHHPLISAAIAKRFLKPLLIQVFLMTTLPGILAQTILIGLVRESEENLPLASANVFLEGTQMGTITNLNGEFRLLLDPGTYNIVASYMGYESQQQEVTLQAGQNVILDFILTPQTIMGEEVTVNAQLRGQRAAISSQLNANGIINVVAEEQIQELPDANAGEALARLPGVSIKRSGGEAQKIVLRGLNEKFSQIQLDGVVIPPTDQLARGVDLSMFSINSLAGIEVVKSLTSDMDADAIAGAVNLVTKKASNIPELRIDAGGGYNKLENSASQYNFGVRYNRRLFKEVLGVQVSATTESRIRSSECYSQGWDVRPDSNYWISSLTAVYTDERRIRTGGSLLLDVILMNGCTIRLNNFFNKTDRDDIKYSRNYPVNGNVNYSITDTERDIYTINNALSGELFLGKIILNWGASHALSLGRMPYMHTMEFSEGGSFGAGMMPIPREAMKGPGELLIPYAYNNFDTAYLSEAIFETSENRDRNLIAYLDLERTFNLSDRINIAIKAGGKYRIKDRTNDLDRFWSPYASVRPKKYQVLPDGTIDTLTFDGSSWEDVLDTTKGNRVSMLNFLAEFPPSRGLFDGKYELNPFIDPYLAREWYELRKNGVTSPNGGLEEYLPSPRKIWQIYSIKEKNTAGYAMATMDLGRMFRLIAGVRLEKEDNDYETTFAPNIDGFYRYEPWQIGDTAASYSATYVLPNFHLRFKPVNWWDLRLAATKTLSRPDFSMRLPKLVVRRTAGVIDRGRPDLRTAESWNYDVIASFFTPKYGLLTVGGFYKRIDNIFYMLNNVKIINSEMERSLNLPTGYSYRDLFLNEPVNSSGTEVYGVEFDLQANLKFLPGFFGNFVLRGNFTMIKSTTMIPRTKLEWDDSEFPPTPTLVYYQTAERLEGQPSNFGNLTLGYDLRGFSGRLSVFFQDDYLTSVDVTGLRDQYQKGYAKWDLALKQAIPKLKTEIMLNVTNLSNFYEGTYWDFRGLDNGSTTYDIIVDFGVRVTL
jgi:outer membrane receptor protein involved in Fe transport